MTGREGASAGGACLDGVPERLFSCDVNSPVGPLRLTVSDRGVHSVEFVDPAPGDSGAGIATRTSVEHPLLDRLAAELEAYFAGTLRRFTLPLIVRGTPFQERAWEELIKIELGSTITYGTLAGRLDEPGGARAAAAACGANRIAIVIPCHRVIAADGTLWGYGGGLARKRLLLDHEAKLVGTFEPRLFE